MQHDIEALDPRGRTPLMLAAKLCHLQSLKCLIAHKANANAECDGWSVVQEAVSTGDRDILTAVLEVRDLQRHVQRTSHVPALLKRLKETPDFYVEMRWEFTSWVPLMSHLCPSDTYRVYKQGLSVRIDTTLLGFDERNWQRGNRSYIFRGDPVTDTATLIEVDHDAQESSVEVMKTISDEVTGIPPTRESVANRLSAPITVNHVDIDKISFERNKSGIWGWRSEKNETINGYDCKAYSASNVEFVTRTRTEHLNEAQIRARNSRTPLQSFLGLATAADEEEAESTGRLTPLGRDRDSQGVNTTGKAPLTAEEYFSGADLEGRDIGRPMRMTSKVQKFKANLWLSEEFPIKLQEQVLPILDLMSTMASPHVSKLKEFITMQLPSGFPVKIEIPLLHILNACVTFGNVFGTDSPVQYVTSLKEEDRLSCVIDDVVFEVPASYRSADHRRQFGPEDEDDLLQLALQRSLIESGTEDDEVDIWEALRVQRPVTPMNNFVDEDVQLQR